MSIQQPDYYTALGINPYSTFREIQKAFFRLSLSYHPDKHTKYKPEEAHKQFVIISAANNVLKDPVSRRKYEDAQKWAYNEDDDGEDTSEHPASHHPLFHGTRAEREARRRERQQTRYANRASSKNWGTEEGPSDWGHGFYPESDDTDEAKPSQPQEDLSAEEGAWLRYRNAKNNLQGLSFSLKDALYSVLELIRSLRADDNIKKRAAKARVQLRSIEVFFHSVQEEMDAVLWPTCLTETTVLRINKMMNLESNIQEFLIMLNSRPGDTSPEQEATETSKLLLKAMGKWAQLCR
ncbi:hypothetical protein KVR01_005937 [Diaporthe batatas]|uniref:uncharacterized protein n=1 Tax=Diaporthe batatas TaxID=748121 RepID=UPI001D03BD21|nr:uncharacterized protein KVR01_005937 [Diaporthe batatas]KAG8164019.1 hypothetical protein KVR01_005937 [Diaporthe batatas]